MNMSTGKQAKLCELRRQQRRRLWAPAGVKGLLGLGFRV